MEPISRPDLPMDVDLMAAIDEAEMNWSHPRNDPRNEIKSAKCRCTPDAKSKSRILLDSGVNEESSRVRLGRKSERASLEAGKSSARWTALKSWARLTKWAPSGKKASLHNGDVLQGQGVLHLSGPNSGMRLDTLPLDILYPILDLVYVDENRSRELCRCSRPMTPYSKIRKVSLEHHIVNSAPLRSVCRAFHGWALENVFKGRNIEVDMSDFKGLALKLGTNETGVVKRLIEDFPRLGEHGVVIYLGSPGQTSNIRSVVEVLRAGQAKIFSGVTLWDLDYYHREQIPGLPMLVLSRIKNRDVLSISELDSELMNVLLGFIIGMYRENRALIVELLLHLVGNGLPLSKLHVPFPTLLDDALIVAEITGAAVHLPGHLFKDAAHRVFPFIYPSEKNDSGLVKDLLKEFCSKSRSAEYFLRQNKGCTLAGLTRGCKSVVFREFIKYNESHLDERRQYVEDPNRQEQQNNSHPSIASFDPHFHSLEQRLQTELANANVEQGYGLSGLFDARHMEFRHGDLSKGMFLRMNWPNPVGASLKNISSMSRNLKSLVIDCGFDLALSAGALLDTLLPLRHTLSKLIYKSRFGVQNTMDSHHTCLLLRQFPRLRKLDLASTFCHRLLEDSGINCNEIARDRNWDLRLPTGWTVCNYAEEGSPALPTAALWTQSSMETFLKSCRAWRDRYEASTHCKSSWDVKIHVVVWEPWGPVGDHDHSIAFMPLAHPPCALLKDCSDGILHEYGFYEEKEGWMVMHMLNGRPTF